MATATFRAAPPGSDAAGGLPMLSLGVSREGTLLILDEHDVVIGYVMSVVNYSAEASVGGPVEYKLEMCPEKLTIIDLEQMLNAPPSPPKRQDRPRKVVKVGKGVLDDGVS